MDKNAIKKYAIWARRELIERVSQKAQQYGIESEKELDSELAAINGVVLSDVEKRQRKALINRIKEVGYTQVIEEVAFTWFNRFIAIRFMEVNGYIPSHVRVFTDESNNFNPQILSEALHIELEGLDKNVVLEMKSLNKDEELFKYLLIVQCNELSLILPRMFQKLSDYTELLLPDNLLRKGSVIETLISDIPEENFDVNSQVGQVEVIGWMYQFFNTELNEQVYDGNMSKSRISKEFLPAATTIYTPDWAIRYMVENSLGKLWLSSFNNSELEEKWKYYLSEGSNSTYKVSNPEEIKCIDPCMGSGHILAYMFDLLVDIYESYGYSSRDAAALIVQNNIYGLDIDDRAAQLAYFTVMMKARQYDRRFFAKGIQPNVISIKDSNDITYEDISWFSNGNLELEKQLKAIKTKLTDAKEYGSIICFDDVEIDFESLERRLNEVKEESPTLFSIMAIEKVESVVLTAKLLAQKYQVVVTNPPYLGNSRFSPKLDKYVKDFYPDEKADLSMVMLKQAIRTLTAKGGYVAFITTSSWMFLGSFEKLRQYMLTNTSISSLVDFGTELFEGKVGHNPIVAWVMCKEKIKKPIIAIRLVEYCYARRDEKRTEYFEERNRFNTSEENILKIPGAPIAYWISEKTADSFNDYPALGEFVRARIGMVSGDNERFLRLWYEVPFSEIEFNAKPGSDFKSSKKWFPLQKGGDYRLWYGNLDYVINWENDGYDLKYDNYKGKRVRSHNYNGEQQFKEGVTWNSITSGKFSCRYSAEGFTHDAAGPLCEVVDKNKLMYVLGMLSSKVANYYFEFTNPTINFPSGYLEALPIIFDDGKKEEIDKLVRRNIEICKEDWDDFERSWNFKKHPLVLYSNENSLEGAFSKWNEHRLLIRNELKANQIRINEIFINIYGLVGRLEPNISDDEVAFYDVSIEDAIKSFISYSVGCMFGRYSLDVDGIICTSADISSENYSRFIPDKDNIIPICDDEYFEDDIVGRFIEFVRNVYGSEYLEQNLTFIANNLGIKGSNSRDVIRKYFIDGFYKDHCSMCSVNNSGKRPFYWLFDSGKKNAFKCLMYMHRYQPDTIARIRTDYVHEQQARYRTAIDEIVNRIDSTSGSDKVKLNKKLNQLKAQDEEIHAYEEKIHHLADQMISINLDDGVKKNYEIFKDVLAKIK